MSTRGLYGIRKNGIDKLTYNHFDSYPEGLGKKVVKFCLGNDEKTLHKFFDLIEVVDGNDAPTKEQVEYCTSLGLDDTGVGEQSLYDWYCLIRNLQGDFCLYQKLVEGHNRIYMIDGIDFIKDSLWCEYAYIINLDDNVLEFYQGFQTEPQEGNRYGTESTYEGFDGTKLYPCKLVYTQKLYQAGWEDFDEDVEIIVAEMIDACRDDDEDDF